MGPKAGAKETKPDERQRQRESTNQSPTEEMGNLAKGASSLVGSPALVAAMLSFTIAQICKVFTHYHTTGKVWIGAISREWRMPSSHTALVVGLTTAIGLKDALDSSIFALCLVFSLVVRAFRGRSFSFQRRLESGLEIFLFSLAARDADAKKNTRLTFFSLPFLYRSCTMPPAFVSTPDDKRKFKSAHRRAPRDHPFGIADPLRDSLGHTPVQVAVGALLGMVVGYAHFNIWLISQGVDL